MNDLALLWPYFRRHRTTLAVGIGSILMAATIGLAAPLVVGRAVDALALDLSLTRLLRYGGLLVAIALVRGLFTYLQRLRLVTMSRDIELDLRDRFFVHLLTQPPEFFQRRTTGDLLARSTNDLAAVRMICGPAIMYASNTVFTGLGCLAFMLHIHWQLTLLALAPMPLVALTTRVFGRRIHDLFAGVQEHFGAVTTQAQEHLAGLRVVRAYARERHQQELFDRENRQLLGAHQRLIRWNAAFSPALELLVGLGYIAVLGYGGLLAHRGVITVGEFVTFYFFLGRLVWPMIAIGYVINLFERGRASLRRIGEVLAVEPAIAEPVAPIDPGPISGEITFTGLDFAYPLPAAGEGEAPSADTVDTADAEGAAETAAAAGPREGFALADIDLEVPAGATVALVGRTGSGKSTLLALVPRLWDPPPGTLSVDGVEIARLPLERLRGAIGMVPQETFLFSATVRENILFGSRRPDEVDDEAVLEAARLAGLTRDLEGFPRGLDTLVGERGITLSGGQKQRLALARALLARPPVLLLDDCLSAVDAHTEEEILGNLRQVFRGRTVLLVSHRVSTVRDADLIVVLDGGRIVERGRHDELLALDGLYADLARRQRLEEELTVA